MIYKTTVAILGIVIWGGLSLASAQQIAAAGGASSDRPTLTVTEKKVAEETKSPTKPQGLLSSECRICRWFELQTATISTRYRFVENTAGVTTNSQLQHNEAFKGRFKIDGKGKYSLNLGLFSGNTLTGGWNNTGVGTGKLFTNLYVKQLFISAKPAAGVEIQSGGLYVERGENTEITSYDNDVYIMGQRLNIKRPKEVFFDQISVTYAYLGDPAKPSVFKRFSRLGQSNYHQFLVTRSIGKRATVSADYTFHAGVETTREGVRITTKELRVLDTVKFEAYQRLDVKADAGFAISGEKSWFKKRLVAGGGYAQIDSAYGGLNGDRYNKGKRLFAYGNFQISPEFGVNAFWTGAVDNPYGVSNRNRLDLAFSYNFLKTLQRAKLL